MQNKRLELEKVRKSLWWQRGREGGLQLMIVPETEDMMLVLELKGQAGILGGERERLRAEEKQQVGGEENKNTAAGGQSWSSRS